MIRIFVHLWKTFFETFFPISRILGQVSTGEYIALIHHMIEVAVFSVHLIFRFS